RPPQRQGPNAKPNRPAMPPANQPASLQTQRKSNEAKISNVFNTNPPETNPITRAQPRPPGARYSGGAGLPSAEAPAGAGMPRGSARVPAPAASHPRVRHEVARPPPTLLSLSVFTLLA